MAQPIRVCSDSKPVASRGNLYQNFPFEPILPDDSDDKPPSVSLRISAVDRQVIKTARAVSGDFAVTFEVVLASSPDTVEGGANVFTLRGITYDVDVIEGTLAFEDVLNEPFPGDSFTPSRFPGVFA
jgi:hypothetical protein